MKRIFCFLLSAAIACSVLTLPAFAASDTVSDTVIEQVIGALEIMQGDQNGNLNLSNKVTRAEFARMLVAASSYKDKVSAVSNVSPFQDVPYTHWAAAYIKTAVEQGWLSGYLNGTYHPSQSITLEEADTGVLKLLGYSTADFAGAYPYGQLSLAKSLGLNDRLSATQGTAMTRKDMMYLFYNALSADTKDGQLYLEVLGYTKDADGHIDYLSVIDDNLNGPYIMENSLSALGVPTSGVTVYRNGYTSSIDAIQKYDVVYYSSGLNTVWAYNNAVTGIYQSASPNTSSPTSVTVSGNTYQLGTSEATMQMSTMGSLNVGDIVTLLLGRNSEIVYVMSASEYANTIYGMVTSVEYTSYQNAVGNTSTARTLTIQATDGQSYQIPCTDSSYKAESMIEVQFSSGTPVVSALQYRTLSGAYTNGQIGQKKLARDVRIMDIQDEKSVHIYASRLLGASIESRNVRFYAENNSGEVTDLILQNFTGDTYEYGVMTTAKISSDSMNRSGSYQYLVHGESQSLTTNGMTLGQVYGPVRLETEDGQLSSIRALELVENPASITTLSITDSRNNTWYFSDSCDVYLLKSGSYTMLSMAELQNNFSSYTIKAYYDKSTKDGGRIRIVIASPKS